MSANDDDPLVDPSLLENLTDEQRKEALAAAAAAKRAEERAERRALERAMAAKEAERRKEREQAEEQQQRRMEKTNGVSGQGVVFVSKRKRALQPSSSSSAPDKVARTGVAHKPDPNDTTPFKSAWSDSQRAQLQHSYLGKSAAEDMNPPSSDRTQKKRPKKKITFRFQWDDTDDTSKLDGEYDGIYMGMTTLRNKRKQSKRHRVSLEDMPVNVISIDTIRTKPLEQMTRRDWRIFRENYDIVVKGGRAPPPLRTFEEPPSPELPKLHTRLLNALRLTMGYTEPTPIQRQAIPIGLQRRDLIGIAETGSGKTAAFGIPLCQFILSLPEEAIGRVADEGPLALVMAPTRELAIQIDNEFQKLLSYAKHITSTSIVGGQPIQQQAQTLRRGVHVVVGTPGRLNDCLEITYLVLNQCCYVVLDEADRMIDMGFAPQMEKILEAMGGLLKSENEQETYQQELSDLREGAIPRHRVTAMFSATMPPDVERMAQQYLRHPAVISIGDQDSRSNARIEQRIMFLASPAQKERALRDLLTRSRSFRDKIIVFVNEKKHADGVSRMIEKTGHRSVVLHGGKSQDQREENLGLFRKGGVVLVATDVAGRGLDIPDVSHVINFDLPTRSIDSYSHRIGRTGRAGKEGLATSFITDEDEGIMAPLKQYLEKTGNRVPDRLARHPAASAGSVGANIT